MATNSIVQELEQPEVEQIYEYQPVDDFDRPLGGKQVIKYKTHDELIEKLKNQSIEQIKQMRELNKRLRLTETTTVPENAPRFDADYVEFSPQPLTPEERVQISRDLLDPDKVEKAQERLITAELGAAPAKIRKTLNQAQQDVSAMRARQEADLFTASTPEYYRCIENFKTMTDFMLKNNLAPVRENFKFAYDELKVAGLLLEAPIVREEVPNMEPTPTKTQSEVDQPSRIAREEIPQPTRTDVRASSGLNRSIVSSTGSTVEKRGYTLEEVERMPSEVYKKKLLTEPGFAEIVDKLSETPKRR